VLVEQLLQRRRLPSHHGHHFVSHVIVPSSLQVMCRPVGPSTWTSFQLIFLHIPHVAGGNSRKILLGNDSFRRVGRRFGPPLVRTRRSGPRK
jgi:hypothetical protein